MKKLGFDYELGADSMIYGSISKGYKSGGMNLGGLEGYDPTQPSGVSATNTPFVEEESVWAYEAGWKNSMLDNQSAGSWLFRPVVRQGAQGLQNCLYINIY